MLCIFLFSLFLGIPVLSLGLHVLVTGFLLPSPAERYFHNDVFFFFFHTSAVFSELDLHFAKGLDLE